MKNLFSLLLVCFLATSVSFACDGHGDGTKKAEVEQSGGEVVVAKFAALNLNVQGMTCMGCENKVKAALKGIDGVVETKKVSSETDEAILTYDPSVTSSEDIVKSLGEKTGYSITVVKNAGVAGEAKACTKAGTKACCASKSAGKTCSKSEAKSCSKTKSAGSSDLEKE